MGNEPRTVPVQRGGAKKPIEGGSYRLQNFGRERRAPGEFEFQSRSAEILGLEEDDHAPGR